MELKKIWEIIWRRKWIIIQAFLITSLTATIGSFLLPPVYETSAKIYIKTSDTASLLLSNIGLNIAAIPGSGQGTETETPTLIALTTVEPVLKKLISRLQLRTRKGDLMEPKGLLDSKFIVSKIFPKPYLEIEQFEETDLIEITASSSDPEEAAMIANTLAEIYINANLKQRREEYRNVITFISKQIKKAKGDYLNALEEIKNFKIKEKTVDLAEETTTAINNIAELMIKKGESVIHISETREKIKILKIQLNKLSETMVSSSAISENPQIEILKKTLSELEIELAAFLTEKRPDHPDVVAIHQKIKKAKSELRNEIMIFQELSTELQNLDRELAALKANVNGINADIDQRMSQLSSIPMKAFTESQLQLQHEVNKGIYSSLLEYLYQAGIAEAMTLSDVKLVEIAAIPKIDKPESPNKVLDGIIGIFLGTIFGLGLAFFVEYLDDTIKTPDEVKEQDLTLLGTVPRFKRRESPLISQRDPKDPTSESYRTIRNSLKFASLDKPISSLLIASSIASEGKTSTVVNIGISISREGKKVLLVDTDLRMPKLHVPFGLSNSIGITNILAEQVKPGDAIKETDVEGLRVLTSGPVPPDPGSMVDSEKMRQLIEDLVQQYDIVILDSPPILGANDAIVLAGFTGSLILVLESGKITRRALSETRERMRQGNVQLLGSVLNKFSLGMGSYYYNYKNGYYADSKK